MILVIFRFVKRIRGYYYRAKGLCKQIEYFMWESYEVRRLYGTILVTGPH